jgi:hypothetical protein
MQWVERWQFGPWAPRDRRLGGSVNVLAGAGFGRGGAALLGVLPAPALEIERDGDDVYVEARSAPQLSWLPPWVWRQVQIDVCVPARYSVDVGDLGGRVAIHGFDGAVPCETLVASSRELCDLHARRTRSDRLERGTVDASLGSWNDRSWQI